MASSSSTAAEDIEYDAEDYLNYKAQLETLFAKNAAASYVYGDVFEDPVTKFVTYHPQAADLLREAGTTKDLETKDEEGRARTEKIPVPHKLPTSKQVKDDPNASLKTFMQCLGR